MQRKGDGPKADNLALSVHRRLVADFNSLLDELLSGDLSPVERFKLQYQKDKFLSKYCDATPSGALDRRSAAISKWRRMELRNANTNRRLLFDETCAFRVKPGVTISPQDVVRIARRTVLRVLGDAPDLEVLYGTFSSGASTGFARGAGNVAAKFKVGADVTAPCWARFQEILKSCEMWKLYRGPLVPNMVRGGSLFTVPKNSEIDRCAVKEPELNMFCQKGIGDYIRKRMRSVLRVDLNDQTRNQRLSREGSVNGCLATLDLSSASDLISDGLVRALLPESWFDLLDDCRSQAVNVDGDWIQLNMFSSMGNGFTFELESLLFYALANAVTYLTGTRGTISTYGDDIIVPNSCAGLLACVLHWFGLKVNTEKSFWSGPFRESCGKHWYKGVDVTPFFVRSEISDVPRLIHFLNRLRAWSEIPGTKVADPRFYAFWRRWAKRVPTALWGGRDVNSIDCLVTNHPPRMRLAKVSKVVRPDQLGAYLQWLRAADCRKELGDSIVTSSVMVETSRYRYRRSAAARDVSIILYPAEMAGHGEL